VGTNHYKKIAQVPEPMSLGKLITINKLLQCGLLKKKRNSHMKIYYFQSSQMAL
jgi:hypothetical protein